MSAFYSNDMSEEQLIATIDASLAAGCNFLDTAQVYMDNEILVGKALKKYNRTDYILATKFGINFGAQGLVLDASRANCRRACEASLERLGVDYIDLYYLHRKDPNTPITETMQELKALVEEGKIRHIGLSECSAADIRAAHGVHPVTAVQLEWSLWTRDVEEEIVPTCRELGIGIVAYSPLGRGFLTSKIQKVEDLAADDWRLQTPRFQEEAMKKNLEIVKKIKAAAEKKGCTPGQLALAWVLAQGQDVVPIPGTRRIKYLEENLGAARVALTAEEAKQLGDEVDGLVVGTRYPEDHMSGMTFHYGKEQQP